MYSLPDGMKGPKIATVVSKKVATKAVVRNKIERRCRETLKMYVYALDAHSAYVIHAKKSAVDAKFSQLREGIKALLKL